MGLVLQDIRDGIRNACGIDSDDKGDAEIDKFANRALWGLVNRFKWTEVEADEDFTFGTGVALLTISSIVTDIEAVNFISVLDPNYNKWENLERWDNEEFWDNYDVDTEARAMPIKYGRNKNDELFVWPVPDIDYDGKLHYWRTLEDLSNSNIVPAFLNSAHELILLGGSWRCYLDLGDPNRAQRYKTMQEQEIRSYVPVGSKEETDSKYAQVKVVRSRSYP